MSKENKPVPGTGIETAEELKAINQAQEEQIAALIEENNTLKIVAEAANTSKRPVSTEPKEFKLGKEKYPFPAPKFHVPGFGVMTATEALTKPDILKWLVENKAGNIE